jgi:hypothetical protein
VNRLLVTPLRSRLGEVTHLLGVLEEVEGAGQAELQGRRAALPAA